MPKTPGIPTGVAGRGLVAVVVWVDSSVSPGARVAAGGMISEVDFFMVSQMCRGFG